MATARFPGSYSITRSSKRKGYLCGSTFMISSTVITVSHDDGFDRFSAPAHSVSVGVSGVVAVARILATRCVGRLLVISGFVEEPRSARPVGVGRNAGAMMVEMSKTDVFLPMNAIVESVVMLRVHIMDRIRCGIYERRFEPSLTLFRLRF